MKVNIKEAEMCQALRLLRQFADPLEELDKESYERLKNSIAKVGQQKPVVLWANILVDGYHRVLALKELEIDTVMIERMSFKTASEALEWKIMTHPARTTKAQSNGAKAH